MDKLQPIDPNTVQAREMPNERTPLELAREMLLECSGPGCKVPRCRVAAALIERSTPVEAIPLWADIKCRVKSLVWTLKVVALMYLAAVLFFVLVVAVWKVVLLWK